MEAQLPGAGLVSPVLTLRQRWKGQSVQAMETPTLPAHRPSHGPSSEHLLAGAAGLADVAEELESLPGGRGGRRAGGGAVTGTGHRREGHSAKCPAVAAL